MPFASTNRSIERTSQVACNAPDERQPSEEGRFAVPHRRANLLRFKRRFFMVRCRQAGALVLALVALLVAAGTGAARNFPATVAGENATVTLPAKPVRIVSLSPTATEDLFA